MEREGYRRVRLCRLCECPVADGGVLVARQCLEKLSRWFEARLNTNLQLDKKHCTVCHFCICDLRYADQNSQEKEREEQRWWPKYEQNIKRHHKIANYYFKYYSDEWMKPCFVKIAPLENEEKLLKEYSQGGFGHKCLYCPLSYASHQILVNHAKTVHPDQIIYCNRKSCGKFFHDKEEKAKHIKIEHPAAKKSLKCIYCGKVSLNKAKLLHHLNFQHKGKSMIKCKIRPCEKYFQTKQERDKHVKECHNSGKYFCCFCDRFFKCFKFQWAHMKQFHKEAFKCNAFRSCPNYFKTEEEMQKHIQEKHSQNNKCIYCGAFCAKSLLTAHIKMYHKDVALRCEYNPNCVTWFKTKEERQKHYLEKHERGDDKVSCPFCNKKLTKKRIHDHLTYHHQNQQVFKCNFGAPCPYYFSNEEDRSKHIQEFHDKIDKEKMKKCVYCDLMLVKIFINMHVQKQHKDVAIRCKFHVNCANYFKTLEDREKHVREVHLAEKIRKPLPCLYCGQILAGKDTLGTHMKNKHAKTAIRCHQRLCFTFFKSQDDLEKHFSLFPKHRRDFKKDERKFTCALCLKSYLEKSYLIKHFKATHCNISNTSKEMCPHCKKLVEKKYCKRLHVISDFCKKCHQKFSCIGLSRRHRRNCKSYHCPVCSESFISDIQLNYHCKTKHTVPTFKWKNLQFKSRGIKCEDCFSYFNSKTSLQIHITRVHENSRVTCDTCKRQFSRKINLQYHISRKHLSMKKFFCSVCNYEFVSENEMRKHVHNKCDKILC